MWIELRAPRRDPAVYHAALSGLAHLGHPMRIVERANGTWFNVNLPTTRPAMDRALGVLQGISRLIIRRARKDGVQLPSLYQSGVRYVREPDGREWWQTVADNLLTGEGDCEDLATHRAAELNEYAGEPAIARTVQTGKHMFHAIVERGDGTIEDPSAALGMMRTKDPYP